MQPIMENYPPENFPSFGELSRDEINKVMAKASSPIPTTTPFTTGLKKAPKSPSRVPNGISSTSSISIQPSTSPPLSPINSTADSTTTSTETTVASINTNLTIETNDNPLPSDTLPGDTLPGDTHPGDIPPGATSPTLSQVPKPKPTTWAGLFKNTSGSANTGGQSGQVSPTTSKSQTISKSAKSSSPNGATKFAGIADILNNYETKFESLLIQPRGLVNNGNICFMNAVLQPLAHCPPFYNLVTKIGSHVAHNFKIVNENVDFEEYGKPLLPVYVYDALRSLKRFDSMRGRQEDAEEALGFLLDGLHEEFISDNTVYEYAQENDEEIVNSGDVKVDKVPEGQDGWFEVGPKNKTSAMRTTEVMESPISRIFGGKIRSVLKCPGAIDSATLEPFQSLQLDIQPENVHTIEDALANMNASETMHDYLSPKGNKVEATKQIYVESLPPILVLHLKRFLYDNVGGVQKLHKHVSYSTELTIRPEWITTARRTSIPITYKLVGAVYHHGKSALGGHYTCDVRRQNDEWLHMDDTNVTTVNESDVAVAVDRHGRPNTDRLAYLLFFMLKN
ncbi:hypothetical protein BC937DRAFT_93112 [Endogone sp. FLAS-F59071]|nr:hypothetical protein BC937DRAFT_93112 [Endogone sp. FLAS-F59071]|eukprot:RUS21287.1 hypothetical protein BC937DRAFT_93112 [Endogone sp. FLAS-F59071]